MARRSNAIATLASDQRAALKDAISGFSMNARERGHRYVREGRVRGIEFDGLEIEATVYGSEVYDTGWYWNGRHWEPDCSCPIAPYCKHAFALAEAFLFVTDGDAPVVREAPARGPRRVRAPLSDRPRSVDAARTAVPLRRSLLKELRSSGEPWVRQRLLQKLLRRPEGMLLYDAEISQILHEKDPDLLCWRLVQVLSTRVDVQFPPELETFRERHDLAERFAERARSELLGELSTWAGTKQQRPPCRLRVVFALSEQAGAVSVSVQTRITTTRMRDEPRTLQQLRQLRNELEREPGRLAPDEAAALIHLTDAIGSNYGLSYDTYGTEIRLGTTALSHLLVRLSNQTCAVWSDDIPAALTERAGVTPAATIRFGAAAVRLLPMCIADGDDVRVELQFVWPDGRARGQDEVVHLRSPASSTHGEPTLIVADGEFHIVSEEPPQSLQDHFRAARRVHIPAAARAQAVLLLAQSFPHLQATLASHTRFVPVRLLIALDLREDDWLQVRVLAHTVGEAWTPTDPPGADARVFEYAPAGRWAIWPPISTPAPLRYDAINEDRGADAERPDDGAHSLSAGPEASATVDGNVWLEMPELERLAPAVEWLEATGAGPGAHGVGGRQPTWADRDVGWWVKASPKQMDRLAATWEARPPGVSFVGSERIHRLLNGEQRVRPLLQIESSGIDWFAISAEWEAEGLRLSDADLARLRSGTSRFVKLTGGWVRRDLVEKHDETALVLADLGIEIGRERQRLSLWQLAGAKAENLQALERFGADAKTLSAIGGLRERIAAFDGLPEVPLPPGLEAELRPYQRRGLNFLAHTAALGLGAVLADDMGLGKTVQALAWLLHLHEREPAGGPTLVVCPASVVHNWVREAHRFTPGLRVLALERGRLRHASRKEMGSYDLVLTNYALLRRDVEVWRDVELRALILDEAQNIKNPDAAVTRAAQGLRTRHRLALTGTPLENRALDLWSIFSVVNPGYLGARAHFESHFDRPDAPAHRRTLLAAKLRPVLLRRTKAEVATDLPARIEERRDCELTKGQRQLYLAELRRSRQLVDDLSATPRGLAQNKIHILAALMRLRQICCHPVLAGGNTGLGSGKFDTLFELLEPLLDEGHKVLIFSQFVGCLRLLEGELRARRIPSHMLTGETIRRERVVDAFQNHAGPCVFLLSLKAGGTGLNLTAASYVVLFDPWWNPAVEAQAIDRSHRIGQDRTVIAYRLLTLGTIEEKIWELQERKAALARDILGEEGFARALTRDDLAYLLADV